MNLSRFFRRLGLSALALSLTGLIAYGTMTFSTGTTFPSGFRLVDGSDLNVMVSQVNSISNGTAGTFGNITATGNLAVTGAATFTAATNANAHVNTGATPPVLTSCGTTPSITGSDTAGIVTMGTTATGCVITFATAYTGTPYCVVSWVATPLASQSYVTSNVAITTTQTSTSNNKLQYVCLGPSGG